MHIAMVTDYYLPTLGGVQTVVKAHTEELRKAGHTVTVLTPLAQPSADPHIVRLPTSPIFAPDGYPFSWPYKKLHQAISQTLTERKVDVVHVHSELFAALAGLRAARDVGVPSVQTMHGRVDVYSRSVLPLPSVSTRLLARLHGRHIPHDLEPQGGTEFTRTALARRMWRLMINQANYADHVIVPSQHFAQKLLGQGVRKPTTVLSNGLENSVLEKIGTPQPRTFDGVEPLRIMWAGRVSPEKRPDVLVRALAMLDVPFHADLYGEGLALSKTRALVKRLGLDQHITLHGAVPQERILQATTEHHVFVSSSFDFDNQPMVVLEAIASGLPVIVSDPDLSEFIDPAGHLTTATPTPTSLAAELNRLVENPELVTTMSKAMLASRAHVRQDEHLEKLLAAYASAQEDANVAPR